MEVRLAQGPERALSRFFDVGYRSVVTGIIG
jgi:hypothetical protein